MSSNTFLDNQTFPPIVPLDIEEIEKFIQKGPVSQGLNNSNIILNGYEIPNSGPFNFDLDDIKNSIDEVPLNSGFSSTSGSEGITPSQLIEGLTNVGETTSTVVSPVIDKVVDVVAFTKNAFLDGRNNVPTTFVPPAKEQLEAAISEQKRTAKIFDSSISTFEDSYNTSIDYINNQIDETTSTYENLNNETTILQEQLLDLINEKNELVNTDLTGSDLVDRTANSDALAIVTDKIEELTTEITTNMDEISTLGKEIYDQETLLEETKNAKDKVIADLKEEEAKKKKAVEEAQALVKQQREEAYQASLNDGNTTISRQDAEAADKAIDGGINNFLQAIITSFQGDGELAADAWKKFASSLYPPAATIQSLLSGEAFNKDDITRTTDNSFTMTNIRDISTFSEIVSSELPEGLIFPAFTTFSNLVRNKDNTYSLWGKKDPGGDGETTWKNVTTNINVTSTRESYTVERFGHNTQELNGLTDEPTDSVIDTSGIIDFEESLNSLGFNSSVTWGPGEEKPLRPPQINCSQFYIALSKDLPTNSRMGDIASVQHNKRQYNYSPAFTNYVLEAKRFTTQTIDSQISVALDSAVAVTMPQNNKQIQDRTRSSFNSTIDNNITNTTIKRLLQAGPDLFTNMFDMYIVESNNLLPVPAKKNKVENEILDSNVFLTRIKNITVPSITRESFESNFLMRSITREKSLTDFSTKGSFTIRGDEHLYFIDYLNARSGTANRISKAEIDKGSYFTLNQLSRLYPMKADGGTAYNIGDSGLSIIVQCKLLSPWTVYQYSIDYDKLPIFIFENVKFLGTSDIQFERDSANTQDFTFNFVYRRLRQESIAQYITKENFATNNLIKITGNPMFIESEEVTS